MQLVVDESAIKFIKDTIYQQQQSCKYTH